MEAFKYFLLIAFFSILGLLMCIFGSGCSQIRQQGLQECRDYCIEQKADRTYYNASDFGCTCEFVNPVVRILQ